MTEARSGRGSPGEAEALDVGSGWTAQPVEPATAVGEGIHPLLLPLEAWIRANPGTATVVTVLVVLLLGELLHRVVRHLILRFLEDVARQTPQKWDQALFDARLPQRMAWGVPLLVWYYGLLLVPFLAEEPQVVARRVLLASMVLVVVRSFDAFLDGVNRIYLENPRSRERPIKGFLQVANVVGHLAGLILIVAILMDRSPLLFLSGLGAMTAVLLLVFRDTLLSLVAGIQITTNDLLRTGDWIEMPQFQADGDVVDIALNSVTVQNWDRTLSVIPTHKFLEHSFKNWRGMSESGGRRIKRAFHVDQSTIRFLTDDEIETFSRWELLRDYMAEKRAQIDAWNRSHPGEDGVLPHHRRLTNMGTLRAYLVAYLRAHPGIHQEMTFLVRQLAPGPEGLPLEVYVFTSSTQWAVYEGIQGDIFDHVLATVPEFGLRVFQRPSGADLVALGERRVPAPRASGRLAPGVAPGEGGAAAEPSMEGSARRS
jgi:miniconductance mechanosensitive channel